MADSNVFEQLTDLVNSQAVAAFLGGVVAIIGKTLFNWGWAQVRKSGKVYSEAAQRIMAILDAPEFEGSTWEYSPGDVSLKRGDFFIRTKKEKIYSKDGPARWEDPDVLADGVSLWADLSHRERKTVCRKANDLMARLGASLREEARQARLAKLNPRAFREVKQVPDYQAMAAARRPSVGLNPCGEIGLPADEPLVVQAVPQAVPQAAPQRRTPRGVLTAARPAYQPPSGDR